MFLTVRGPTEEALVRRGMRRCWLEYYANLAMWSVIAVHWSVRPALAAALYGQKTRLLNTWPVFVHTWTQFAVSYIYQCPVIICISVCYCMYDNMFLGVARCILCHFDILRHRLGALTLENRTEGLLACIEYNRKILR